MHFRYNNNNNKNNNNKNNNQDDGYCAIMCGKAMSKVNLDHLKECGLAPGGSQHVGAAANLNFLSASTQL